MTHTTALLLTAMVSVAANVTPAPGRGSAPADESFGPFKYSAVSVRTKIDELGRAYRERWENDASLIHDAEMVESSLRVWAQRYPRDPWLAPTAFHLAQLYQEIQSPTAHNLALAEYRYVAQSFGNTREGHRARIRLAQGLPALHAESPVRPTANPYAAAPTASPSPPAVGASPSATPSAVSSPSPSASPTPKRTSARS